jgi:hypothetical protein
MDPADHECDQDDTHRYDGPWVRSCEAGVVKSLARRPAATSQALLSFPSEDCLGRLGYVRNLITIQENSSNKGADSSSFLWVSCWHIFCLISQQMAGPTQSLASVDCAHRRR